MAEFVRITEVGPRDGLQNEPGVIPTAEKVELVRLLCGTGVDEVEVTSFVSPKWVPQLGDAAEVLGQLHPQPNTNSPLLSALVPNERGMEGFLSVNRDAGRSVLGKVCLFTAASETFSKKNTNATIAESIGRWLPVLRAAHAHGLAIKMYVSCAFGCPFEGEVTPRQVADTVAACLNAAAHSDVWGDQRGLPGIAEVEISLGDTIGVATPRAIRLVHEAVASSNPRMEGYWAEQRLASMNLHAHDTTGRAAECVRAALDLGIRSFDGAVAGLGGCPYASTPGKRAPGNIATQALVSAIQDAGYRTNVKFDKLEGAGRFAMKIVGEARARAATPASEARP